MSLDSWPNGTMTVMSGPSERLPWRWEDPTRGVRAGDDPSEIAREALRRTVEIRDKHTMEPLRSRPVLLVDVLNRLCGSLAIDTKGLWEMDRSLHHGESSVFIGLPTSGFDAWSQE
jgi:hypothetical protein